MRGRCNNVYVTPSISNINLFSILLNSLKFDQKEGIVPMAFVRHYKTSETDMVSVPLPKFYNYSKSCCREGISKYSEEQRLSKLVGVSHRVGVNDETKRINKWK